MGIFTYPFLVIIGIDPPPYENLNDRGHVGITVVFCVHPHDYGSLSKLLPKNELQVPKRYFLSASAHPPGLRMSAALRLHRLHSAVR